MITKEQSNSYTNRLNDHIRYVQAAGKLLGIDGRQLAKHDQSKWSKEEFDPYANFFVNPDGSHVTGWESKERPDDYIYAWLHHLHYNPHHWQHWVFPDSWTPPNSNVINGVMEMPHIFADEMIADWQGASKAYTGDWDMEKWLKENVSRITVHPKTSDYLKRELSIIGYETLMNKVTFKSPKDK